MLRKVRRIIRWFFLTLMLLSMQTTVSAKVYLTVGEALEMAFPECEVQRQTIYLTEEQEIEARKLANEPLENLLVYPYVATKDGQFVGVAYFNSHIVRTLPETIMVAVNRNDQVQRIELLVFKEPPNYIPPDIWYRQFRGKQLNDQLALNRGIRGILGATLTTRYTTNAVRRMLAIHNVIKEQLHL